MSTNRKMQGGWVEPDRLPKGPTGRALCRWCKTNEVRGRRKTFCSQACVDEYLVRVDPQYARAKVRERDQDGNDLEDWIYGKPPAKTTFVTFQGDKVVRVTQYP